MKLKDPKSGLIYDTRSGCISTGPCSSCPIELAKGSQSCSTWLNDHPMLAASRMGYNVIREVVRESEDTSAPPDGTGKDETGPDPCSRRGILLQATRCVCGDRDQDYGSPENSLSAIASLWADYIKAKYGVSAPLTGVDASAMMVLFKIARVATGHGKADNWVDAAGYAACGGEIEGVHAGG